jgi:hypothetical protein
MAPNSTTSMDLPPVLAQLLGPMTPPVTQSPTMQMPPMQQAFNPAASGLSSGMTQDNAMMPSYAMGGMVGASGMPEGGLGAPGMPQGGMPQMTGAGAGAVGLQEGGAKQPMNPQQVEMQIKEFMQQNPQQVAQIQQVIQAGLQSGEITMEDLNMLEQLATTALQNPEMYPYIRQFAIQQGFAGEQDISPEYDEGLVITVLIATRVAKQGSAPMGGAPAGMEAPSFAMGGMVDDMTVRPGDMAAEGGGVEGPGTGTSDSVPIRVSTGEYVIPANVVRMKGKEFFDSMLEKYKDT